jgi:hypothetical protein
MTSLNKHEDFDTLTWRKVKEYCDVRIATLHAQLEGDLPPEATAKVRGRIMELKLILTLDQPAPKLPQKEK